MINLQLYFIKFRAWLANLIMPRDFVFSANNMNYQELKIMIEHPMKEVPILYREKAEKKLLQAASIHIKSDSEYDLIRNKYRTQYSLIVMKRD